MGINEMTMRDWKLIPANCRRGARTPVPGSPNTRPTSNNESWAHHTPRTHFSAIITKSGITADCSIPGVTMLAGRAAGSCGATPRKAVSGPEIGHTPLRLTLAGLRRAAHAALYCCDTFANSTVPLGRNDAAPVDRPSHVDALAQTGRTMARMAGRRHNLSASTPHLYKEIPLTAGLCTSTRVAVAGYLRWRKQATV